LLLIFLTSAGPACSEPDAPSRELPQQLLTDLAVRSARYLEQAPRFHCVESVRNIRYRETGRRVRESEYLFEPGGTHDGNVVPDFRFRVRPEGRIRTRHSRHTDTFPSTADWVKLFSAENQPWFIYRDLGIRVEGFDLVREIEFRGWFPLVDGRDIREWEGTALVEVTRMNLVEVRARPLNQEARVAKLFDRWSRAFKIKVGISAGPFLMPFVTFRLARKPLAHDLFLRFDHPHDDVRLPTELRYETRRQVSPDDSVAQSTSVRRYGECGLRTSELGALDPPDPARVSSGSP